MSAMGSSFQMQSRKKKLAFADQMNKLSGTVGH